MTFVMLKKLWLARTHIHDITHCRVILVSESVSGQVVEVFFSKNFMHVAASGFKLVLSASSIEKCNTGIPGAMFRGLQKDSRRSHSEKHFRGTTLQ